MNSKFFRGNRKATAPFCPCGKSNADGKFSPFADGSGGGKCHACGEVFVGEKQVKGRGGKTGKAGLHRLLRQKYATLHLDTLTPPDGFEPELVRSTLRAYERNVLFRFLCGLYPPERVKEVFLCYQVGTHSSGAAIFWQKDGFGQYRSGKVIHYLSNGHRDPQRRPFYLHAKEQRTDSNGNRRAFRYKQCLFGEHLLKYLVEGQKMFLVEGEKTAIVAALELPRYLWLATGGASNLRRELLLPLIGYELTLCPDTDKVDLWRSVMETNRRLFKDIALNDISLQFENLPKGADLADVFLSEKSGRKDIFLRSEGKV